MLVCHVRAHVQMPVYVQDGGVIFFFPGRIVHFMIFPNVNLCREEIKQERLLIIRGRKRKR